MTSSVAIKGRNKARIMTDNVLLAHEPILEISSADEAKDYFGETSDEYKAAQKFFSTTQSEKCACKTLQFAPCNQKYGDKVFSKYTVTAKKNEVKCVKDSNGLVLTYGNIVECFRDIPAFSTLKVKLAEDIVFVSESTKAATNRDFTAATSTTDDDILHGIVIRDDVKAIVDLNGKQLSFDIHVFTNHGNLIITDTSSAKNGRCYTTNFDGIVDGRRHTDSSWDVGSCECIMNFGNMLIEAGWFGTNVADMKPRVNDVNWGVCLQNGKHGFTRIRGGYFTTVTNKDSAIPLQTWANAKTGASQNSFLPTVDKNVIGSAKNPHAFIMEMHYGGRMIMEGGTIYGTANGAVGVIGDYTYRNDVMISQETTAEDYNAFTLLGGEIVNGFKGYVIPSGLGITQFNSFIFAGGNSTNHNSTSSHSDQSNKLPSQVLPFCYSRADLKTGVIIDAFESRDKYVLSGKVHCEYGVTLDNCTVEAAFKELEVFIGEPVRRVTLGQSLADTHAVDSVFYNGTFINKVKPSELEELEEELANESYMHNIVCEIEGLEDDVEVPEVSGGIGITTDRDDSFARCVIAGVIPTKIKYS